MPGQDSAPREVILRDRHGAPMASAYRATAAHPQDQWKRPIPQAAAAT
jgi:hypothetical protein